jgi:hypothetical protein
MCRCNGANVRRQWRQPLPKVSDYDKSIVSNSQGSAARGPGPLGRRPEYHYSCELKVHLPDSDKLK